MILLDFGSQNDEEERDILYHLTSQIVWIRCTNLGLKMRNLRNGTERRSSRAVLFVHYRQFFFLPNMWIEIRPLNILTAITGPNP